MAIGIGDVWTIGRSLTVTGPGVGAVLAYLVIAVLLFWVSPPLAVVVVGGVPVLALVLGPALGRLQRAGTDYRGQQGLLTGRIIDIIGGLSVLNGLGGKQTYADRFRQQSQQLQRHGYRVGRVTGIIQATGMALPTLFMAVVVWMAARLAMTGEISVGELVAVFGYAAVLVVPVSNFIEGAVDINRALVAGRRVTDFLALQREGDAGTASAPGDGDLVDQQSQVTVRSGTFTAIATARQAEAVALIGRLGGFQPGATWNGTPLAEITPAVVREQLMVADNDAALFAGTLAAVVAGRHTVDERAVLEALQIAAGDDLAQATPEGLGRRIASGGSNLSGGQRQRVRLARAVLTDPTVFLAVDPTSAVDAATEERIVERLVRARRGRTTVIATTSALMLASADEVHLVVGGRSVATGTHTSLLRDVPAYAALVLRGETPGPSAADGQEA